MNTLTIQIPKGYKVESFDKDTGEIKFAELPKGIKERIQTFDDVLSYHGINSFGWTASTLGLDADELAYRKLKLIVSALNEGWEPDWENNEWDKYYPWFNMGSPSGVGFSYYDCGYWNSSSHVGSRLCFKSSELAEYAGKQFLGIYKDFFTLK